MFNVKNNVNVFRLKVFKYRGKKSVLPQSNDFVPIVNFSVCSLLTRFCA